LISPQVQMAYENFQWACNAGCFAIRWDLASMLDNIAVWKNLFIWGSVSLSLSKTTQTPPLMKCTSNNATLLNDPTAVVVDDICQKALNLRLKILWFLLHWAHQPERDIYVRALPCVLHHFDFQQLYPVPSPFAAMFEVLEAFIHWRAVKCKYRSRMN